MGSDARVKMTKTLLSRALLALMEEKPLQEITITEVCNAAGVNRATFYNHYRNCYDLLEDIENAFIEEYRQTLLPHGATDTNSLVTSIFQMLEKNSDLCRILIFKRTDDTLLRRMIKLAESGFIESWQRMFPDLRRSELEMLFTCVAHGIVHVILEYYPTENRSLIVPFINGYLERLTGAAGN